MLASVLVQQAMLVAAVLGCIILVFSSMYDIIRTSQTARTKNKRARHQQITVLLDAREATKADITATLASLAQCRYSQYDVVLIAPNKHKSFQNKFVHVYSPKDGTSQTKYRSNAYNRSKKGVYILHAKTGARFSPNILQQINRHFHFSITTQKICMLEDTSAAGLERFHHIIGKTIFQQLAKASAFLHLPIRFERKFYAVRNSKVTNGKQEVQEKAYTIKSSIHSGWAWLGGTVFVAFAAVILGQYVMLGYSAQLLAGIIFMATVSLVLALLQESTARRTLLLFSPSALFVLLVTLLVSMATVVKQQKKFLILPDVNYHK